jgi:hypothetical protein
MEWQCLTGKKAYLMRKYPVAMQGGRMLLYGMLAKNAARAELCGHGHGTMLEVCKGGPGLRLIGARGEKC